MIGQKNNISLINQLKNEGNLKPFMLLYGPKNSGKKFFCKEIAKILNYSYMFIDNNIDAIRAMLEEAHNRQLNRVFIITDIENLNFRAQEVLLKITEEPPAGCFIIGTTNVLNLLKTTLRNRAYIITMEYYNKEDLIKYASDRKYDIDKKDNLIGNSIYSPTLIDYYYANGGSKLKKYKEEIKKWLENIVIVSAGNALKAVNLFKLKSDDKEEDKLDFDNFLLLLSEYLVSDENYKYCKLFSELSLLGLRYRNEWKINGVNKEQLIKDYIIKFRQLSKKYEFNGFAKSN